MDSFLLIGQSNMAGRGFLNEAHEIDTEHIYTLRNGRWQKMFRPITPDRKFSGVSLAESFAECYANKYNADVGLICCADGGTKLDQWMPGEVLFDHAVFQAKLAMRTSRIVGVLWHQGESDCAPELYPYYKEKFEKIMSALRKELGLQNTPFILGALGDYLKNYASAKISQNYKFVNEALKSIVKDNDFTGFVSAEGLTSNPDNLHFNADSLYKFGIRYFEEFEKLFSGNNESDTIKDSDTERSEIELL